MRLGLFGGSTFGPNEVERRTHTRFAIRAPIIFKTSSVPETPIAGGFTRDISAHGVCILCDEADRPAVDNEIAIEVLLPSISDQRGSRMRLRSTGHVVRMSSADEASGFAMSARFDTDNDQGR